MSVFIPTAAPRGRMRGWDFAAAKSGAEEPLRRRRRRQAAVWVAYIAHLCRRGSGDGLSLATSVHNTAPNFCN